MTQISSHEQKIVAYYCSWYPVGGLTLANLGVKKKMGLKFYTVELSDDFLVNQTFGTKRLVLLSCDVTISFVIKF